MNILIIEDEPVAAKRLQLLLNDYDPNIKIKACIDTIEESVEWLQNNKHPDLIMLDIQIGDGFSFEILKKSAYNNAVIFTTAYSAYALEAFDYYSIDYLLKPITQESLAKAVNKYKLINFQHQPDYKLLLQHSKDFSLPKYKERFLARIGHKLSFVLTSEIVYFRADDKVVYIIDIHGNKLPIDFTMEKLETILDPQRFFRINRKVIVSIESIAQIKPYYNNRLVLLLKYKANPEDLIISRERVAAFREWAEGL